MEEVLQDIIEQIRIGSLEVNSYLDPTKNSPIHIAATLNDFDSIAELLSLGSDINQKNELGEDALHVALNAESSESIICLIENGAQLEPIELVTKKIMGIGDSRLLKFYVEHCRTNKIDVDFKEPLRTILKRPAESGDVGLEDVAYPLIKRSNNIVAAVN